MPRPAPEGAAAQIRVPKPVVGDFKSFSVCVSAGCEVFQQVGGRARAVGQHLAIFVDTAAPATGLSDADLDSLVTIFDTRLYPIDTSAFGRPSDINQDSVVMVLMTSAVNRLTPVGECSDGVVLGFFLGADIDPGFAGNPRVNHAEVIYSLVADPSGEVTCPLTVAQVKRAMPVIMIHEFQHMISYNQHVLARQGLGEVLWLNEALSHYAEELGGRSYLGEGDTATFRVYLSGDLFNAYRFLEAPHSHYLLPNPIGNLGTLAERGAQWLYVRYLVDRHAGDTTRASWNGFTRRIVETALTGASNVAFAIGEPFAQSVGRWALANWVDDLPAFTTPPELSYTSWNFRTEFARLNTNDPGRFPLPFPLVPTSSAGSAVDLSGTLRAGSAVYHRVLQAAGAPSFLLRLRAPDGYDLAPSYTPQLNVIRIR
jgi:hypothetical protein